MSYKQRTSHHDINSDGSEQNGQERVHCHAPPLCVCLWRQFRCSDVTIDKGKRQQKQIEIVCEKLVVSVFVDSICSDAEQRREATANQQVEANQFPRYRTCRSKQCHKTSNWNEICQRSLCLKSSESSPSHERRELIPRRCGKPAILLVRRDNLQS